MPPVTAAAAAAAGFGFAPGAIIDSNAAVVVVIVVVDSGGIAAGCGKLGAIVVGGELALAAAVGGSSRLGWEWWRWR